MNQLYCIHSRDSRLASFECWKTMHSFWNYFFKCYFVVDSVDELKKAFKNISFLKKVDVEKDVNEFLDNYSKRLIYAPPNQQCFLDGSDLMGSFKLNTALKNISNAIKISLTS